LAAFVFQAADAALPRFPPMDKCHDGPERANPFIAQALTKMFSYIRDHLRMADRMLVEAQDVATFGRI